MQIKNAKYLISSPSYQKCPIPDKPEYAFIGRSNVGKSSLINMLAGRQQLAKTSATPGKTQMINHFLITSAVGNDNQSEWYLVDLPGYGYAKRAKTDRSAWSKMIEDYLLNRENLVSLFILIDSRHPPQKIDVEFVNQAYNWELPFTLIFTKSDKEKPAVVERNVNAFVEVLKENRQYLPQVIITSAAKRTGKDEVLALIEQRNNSVAEAFEQNKENK